MTNTGDPPRIPGLASIADNYRFILCDAWGVIHDGLKASTGAASALRCFRDSGGIVLVITNAPRPKAEVVAQFNRFGVDPAAYDDVVTSGEATRLHLAERPGARVFHLGPDRDLPLYAGLDLVLSGEDTADLIACTGLFDDESETPGDYADRFRRWAERGLPMVCANPDRLVNRGAARVWCAGALAEAYAAIGGDALMIGKPHPAVYETALARFAELAGTPVDRDLVLAVGDGAETDLRGAVREGLDVLFVTGGIHADLFGDPDEPEPSRVADFLDEAGLGAVAFLPRLVW